MVIHELTREECFQVLAHARLARLACALDNQPYVVPVSLAYYAPPGEEPCLYGFTTLGQKVDWMRANPLVCVEVDEVESYDQWVSVIVLGRYEELPAPPAGERLPTRAATVQGSMAVPHIMGRGDETLLAYEVLQAQCVWWEPALSAWAARTHRGRSEPLSLVYYKVWIDQITGKRASADARDASPTSVPPARARKRGWLRRAVARMCGGTPS